MADQNLQSSFKLVGQPRSPADLPFRTIADDSLSFQ
jgi:hypothetical protein